MFSCYLIPFPPSLANLPRKDSAGFWRDWVNPPSSLLCRVIMCQHRSQLSDPPLDRFKGRVLQVTFSYTAQVHRSSRLDFSCQLPHAQSTAWLLFLIFLSPHHSSLPLSALHCRVQNEMHASQHNCHYWHPAWRKMSIFILWAEFISHVCYTQFRCVSFPSEWQMRWKILTSKTRSLEVLTLLAVSELKRTAWKDTISKSGRFRLSQNGDILCWASLW